MGPSRQDRVGPPVYAITAFLDTVSLLDKNLGMILTFVLRCSLHLFHPGEFAMGMVGAGSN